MRFLIGAACVVIIACGGYYLYSAWSEHRDAQERSAALEAARAHLFELAEAKPDEVEKVRKWCRIVVMSAPDTDLESHKRLARNCVVFGYGS